MSAFPHTDEQANRLARENIGAGALGGAAVGAVAALGLLSSTGLMLPLIATGVGAGLGTLVGSFSGARKTDKTKPRT